MSDLGITDSSVGALQVSIFLFAFAVGPLFLAPLSELHGRAIILNMGNLLFVAFSIGGGFAQTVCVALISTVPRADLVLSRLSYRCAASSLD
jgi:MFS family permease